MVCYNIFIQCWQIFTPSQWRIQGGATGACPPKGPDSFVLTYKFFETELPRELAPPYEVGTPLREILDPPLLLPIVPWNLTLSIVPINQPF